MKKVLLLSGSCREKSTAKAMADYLGKVLKEKGCEVSFMPLIAVFDQKVSMDELMRQIEKADCVGMIISCYVNTVPYPVLWCMEELAKRDSKGFKGKELFAIGHGGMPYNDVHESCVLTWQCFAERMEMKWLGGAVRGLTPMINGKSLEEAGGVGRKIMKGLGLMAEDVAAGREISPGVQKAFNIFFPSFINPAFVKFLNWTAVKDRAAHGVVDFDRKVY